MEEYRSNSHKLREAPAEPVLEKKLVPVVGEGEATIQKKSGFGKVVSSIIVEDIRDVGREIVTDIIIPSIKTSLDNIVSNGIHMLLFGRAAEPKGGTFTSRISYNGFYKQPYNEPSLKVNSNPNYLDFDNIIFPTRGKAEAALSLMEDVLDSGYIAITIGDLYEISGIKDYVPDWSYNNYGWTTLRNVEIKKCIGQDGYYLTLPPARLIK